MFRFAKVNTHFLHASGDHQNVSIHFASQQRGGKIFIDNRIHTLVIALFAANYRNPAAACANHYKTLLDKRADGIRFDNALRFRRGHHAAVSAPGVFNKSPVRMGEFQRFALLRAKECANRFGRMGKVRIVFVHFHLSNHGHGFFVAAFPEAVIECLLD
ncbi:hypothetical protein D3C75_686440 [compost metagenome]